MIIEQFVGLGAVEAVPDHPAIIFCEQLVDLDQQIPALTRYGDCRY
jgi:hypothetical protein